MRREAGAGSPARSSGAPGVVAVVLVRPAGASSWRPGRAVGAAARDRAKVMPICRWPTTEHQPSRSRPTTPASSTADSPGAMRPVSAPVVQDQVVDVARRRFGQLDDEPVARRDVDVVGVEPHVRGPPPRPPWCRRWGRRPAATASTAARRRAGPVDGHADGDGEHDEPQRQHCGQARGAGHGGRRRARGGRPTAPRGTQRASTRSGTKAGERTEHQHRRKRRARRSAPAARTPAGRRWPAPTRRGPPRSRTALAARTGGRPAAEHHGHEVGEGAEQHLGDEAGSEEGRQPRRTGARRRPRRARCATADRERDADSRSARSAPRRRTGGEGAGGRVLAAETSAGREHGHPHEVLQVPQRDHDAAGPRRRRPTPPRPPRRAPAGRGQHDRSAPAAIRVRSIVGHSVIRVPSAVSPTQPSRLIDGVSHHAAAGATARPARGPARCRASHRRAAAAPRRCSSGRSGEP